MTKQQQITHAASLLVALLLGYLLASLSQADGSLQTASYEAEFFELREHQAKLLAAIEAINSTASLSSHSGETLNEEEAAQRIAVDPAKEVELEKLIAQIDQLRRELEASLDTFEKASAHSPTAMLRRAAQSTAPRNDVAIFEMIEAVRASDAADISQSDFDRNHMMTMDQALQRFGRPDEIVHHQDSHVYWGYEEREQIERDRTQRVWKLDLTFKQGLLFSVSGKFYDR